MAEIPEEEEKEFDLESQVDNSQALSQAASNQD